MSKLQNNTTMEKSKIQKAIEYFEAEKERLIKSSSAYDQSAYWVNQGLAQQAKKELEHVIVAMDALLDALKPFKTN